jgi:hypothetical protein
VVKKIVAIKHYRREGNLGFESKVFNAPVAQVSSIRLSEDLVLAAFPGEYFNDFVLDLKRESPFKYSFLSVIAMVTLAMFPR